MLIEGQEPIPGYRLEKFLGRGQFGEVWRASSPGGTHVALKFLNVRERQGRKEFRAIQKIKVVRHPHLVQTYALWLLDDQMQVIDDVGFESASPMILDSVRATMFVDTESTQALRKPCWLAIATVLCEQNLMERLQDWQHRGQSGIPIPELMGYMEDAAKAIDFLNAPRHELGDGPVAIHHCDIKPENIMILGDLAVVGDFGVARILQSGGSNSRSSTMGGSIAYASPESFENKTESTSDQYALAITYYELRTGKLPFRDESAASVMKDKQLGKLDFSGVNPKEQKVLQIATSVQPAKRFPTARQFVEALQAAALNRPQTKTGKSKSALWWIVSLLPAIGLIVYFATIRPPQPDKPPVPALDPKLSASQYDSALAIVRQSSFDDNKLRLATEEAVKAIQAGYEPTMLEAIGNFSIGIDSLVDEAVSLVDIHPAGNVFVAGHDQQLDFYRLDNSERTTLTLSDLADARLTRLVWLADKLVMLDDRDQIRYLALTEPPTASGSSKTEILIEAQPRSFAAWSSSDFRDGLLLLKGQKGQTIGGFKPTPGIFESQWWSNDDPISTPQKLQQLELCAETFGLGSDDGQQFIIVSQERSRIAVCRTWNRADATVFDLLPELSKEVTNVHAACFLENGDCLVIVGETPTVDQLAVLVFGYTDQRWSIEKVVYLEDESMNRTVLVDDGRIFYVGQGTQIARWSREPSGNWAVNELAQFDDQLSSDPSDAPESAKSVTSLCPHPSGWLLSGHEDGKVMLLKQDGPQARVRFEMVRCESEVEQLSVIQDRLFVLTKDGTLAWFDLREGLLVAEACSQTGRTPKPLTLTPSISQ